MTGGGKRCPHDGREIGPKEQRFVVVDQDDRTTVERWYCERRCYLAHKERLPAPVSRRRLGRA